MGFKGHIGLVDDDAEMRSMVEDYLISEGYQVTSFSAPEQVLAYLKDSPLTEPPFETLISDVQMPGMNGIELTEAAKAIKPDLPVILITAFGSIESAVTAVRKGAFDYITKPFKLTELSLRLERSCSVFHLTQENQALKTELRARPLKGKLLGKSKAMLQIFELIDRVAQVQANVLITGESGTGKEVVARAIHEMGPRAKQPFVAINVTAIPDTLLESELFGHAKGAFTGAHQKKRGLFEEAHGGTLFLDEIGDMDIALQAKLLRVIQDRKVRGVGENTAKDIDVRIIAATHKDLKQMIKTGAFREDLYYRLSVIPVVIPSLRHRREDIPMLANFFLHRFAAQNNLPVKGFTHGALQALLGLKWEGNVRELENMVERLVVMSSRPLIQESDIPLPKDAGLEEIESEMEQSLPSLEALERRYLQLVLEKSGGKKDKAARILGINRRTLYRKEREYGLIPEGSPENEAEIPADSNFDLQAASETDSPPILLSTET